MRITFSLFLFLFFCLWSNSQVVHTTDTLKRGWTTGFLPAVSFDPDLGVFYGIVINPFDFGNGSRYPDYMQSLLIQAAGYSRGSSEHYINYDSFTLFPGMRFMSGIKYIRNRTYPFYGFNGNSAIYNHRWEVTTDPEYRSRVFYRQDRRIIRLFANIQDTIAGTRFQWHAGFEFNSHKIDTVNTSRLNRRLDEDEQLPYSPTLYELYSGWGLVNEQERNGGNSTSLLIGLVYDTRNRLTNPDRGVFTEINLRWFPGFLGSRHFSGVNVGIIHRQYINLLDDRLTFACRIWYNASLWGDQPYYTRQLLTTFTGTEGLGGSETIRGILMQRIISKDFLLATLELRTRIFSFRFINQNWYLGSVTFMDGGRILEPIQINPSLVPWQALPDYLGPDDKSVHLSAGSGLKLVMNENFVLSAEYAVPFDRQDGRPGLYLGLNYMF